MLGAFWRQCGPILAPHAVVAIVTMTADELSVPHQVVMELVNEDGQQVTVPTPQGLMAIRSEGGLSVPEVTGELPIGQEFDVPFVANVGAGLPLSPGRTYVWQLWIDGETRDEWRQTFYVRPSPTT